MTTAQRRTEILQLLKKAAAPVAAKELAAHFGVSRQVIVQVSKYCPPTIGDL